MDQTSKSCPYCGSPLPRAAAFCPHCAQSLRPRRTMAPPLRRWRRLLRPAVILAVLAAAMLAGWRCLAPRTFDAYGQVTYTDADGTYQLLVTFQNERFTPQPEITEQAEADGEYRMPSRLFINHVDTGANAGQIFLQKVEWASAELLQPEDSPSPMACSQPEYRDFSPDSALVSLVDFAGRSAPAELVWTLRMENGDTIRLRQKIAAELVETYDFGPEDAPMDTAEDLQALVDRIAEEVPLPAVVNLHLPVVTYQGGLTIGDRPVNLFGSADASGRRTAFTGTVRVAAPDGPICYFHDLDFTGDGSGVGVSASSRFWAENCAFTNWKTGVLGYGDVWVNVIGCRFTGNGVGFHFNSAGKYATHTLYNDNLFEHNGTAVLLERVPTEETLNFQGCRFTGNGTDIDNRCGHSLEIAQAVFE